jgi:hypothetical protein
MAVSIHEYCLHVKYLSEVVTPYSPGVDDLSAAGVAPPALGIGARIHLTDVANTYWGLALLVGIIALTLAIVYLPRLFRRR